MIFKQRGWTEAELQAQGFRYYERRKQLVMAGRLPSTAAPLQITYPLETVNAEAGDVICFDPGEALHDHLLDYEHWSVKPNIFRSTYRRWDIQDWHPSEPEHHLMHHGCLPYYKFRGTWAKRLKVPLSVQTLESQSVVDVSEGMWLVVGEAGEPWHMTHDTFHERYIVTG